MTSTVEKKKENKENKTEYKTHMKNAQTKVN